MGAPKFESSRGIRAIARRLRDQRGFALPTTLLMLTAALATVSVGVVGTIQVQHGTIRDQGTKSALQLAQTSVNEALLLFNRVPGVRGNACSPVGSTPDAGGWCAPVTDASGTFTYQAKPSLIEPVSGFPTRLEVVGTGTDGGATRRVDVTASSAAATNPFLDYSVRAAEDITLDSNAQIHAGTATNGSITIASNAKQCGHASVGVGESFNLNSNSGYFSDPTCVSPISTYEQQDLDLPPVQQGDAPTNNNNDRFFASDRISGNLSRVCWNGKNGSGATDNSCGARHLNLQSTAAVTLGGSKYSFCKLTMSSNTSLLVASGTDTNIYFDSPEACGYPSGTAQLEMASNTRITSNSGSPVHLLFVGSTSRATQINLSSNTDLNAACVQNVTIYAPLSDIDMNSNSTYCGALAGKTLHLDSHADVRTPAGAGDWQIPPTNAHYTVSRFVECTAASASPPNAGC